MSTQKMKKGFTLIELMVVIVIIGILAAIAIPKLFGMTAKAKASEVGPAAGTWSKLQVAYIIEVGKNGTYLQTAYVAPGQDTEDPAYVAAKATYDACMTDADGDAEEEAECTTPTPAGKTSNFVYDEPSTVGTWNAKTVSDLNSSCKIGEEWTGTHEGGLLKPTMVAPTNCTNLTPSFNRIGG